MGEYMRSIELDRVVVVRRGYWRHGSTTVCVCASNLVLSHKNHYFTTTANNSELNYFTQFEKQVLSIYQETQQQKREENRSVCVQNAPFFDDLLICFLFFFKRSLFFFCMCMLPRLKGKRTKFVNGDRMLIVAIEVCKKKK